jgi:hypothetical protein
MASKTLLLAAAVAVTFTGSATAGDGGATSGTVNVCHRTGPKTGAISRGHVLTLPASAIPAHTGHGDVVLVGPDADDVAEHLRQSGGCGINDQGDVLDADGGTVQPATQAPPTPTKGPR